MSDPGKQRDRQNRNRTRTETLNTENRQLRERSVAQNVVSQRAEPGIQRMDGISAENGAPQLNFQQMASVAVENGAPQLEEIFKKSHEETKQLIEEIIGNRFKALTKQIKDLNDRITKIEEDRKCLVCRNDKSLCPICVRGQ